MRVPACARTIPTCRIANFNILLEGGVDDGVDDELCDGVTDSHRIARRCD